MLYRFLSPVGYSEVVQIIVNATDLHEAFEKFMAHPRRPEEGSFGVWKRGRLIAEVGSRWSPVSTRVQFRCHAIGKKGHGVSMGLARPSEN